LIPDSISGANVLGRVRESLGRAAGQLPAPLAAPALCVPQLDRNTATELFVRNFENLSGKCFRAPDAASACATVAQLLEGAAPVVSNSPFLREIGITSLAGAVTGFTDRDRLRVACAEAGAGITSADYALADTGTLVLFSSHEEARVISLLPPVHVAVFPASRILTGLDELLSVTPNPAQRSSAMVLITGPSRTADIEQILVRGVHGPGRIFAVIVG
jgi:L-lactate dehydrogenase complex protein LldG